jgi:hypothetical protein
MDSNAATAAKAATSHHQVRFTSNLKDPTLVLYCTQAALSVAPRLLLFHSIRFDSLLLPSFVDCEPLLPPRLISSRFVSAPLTRPDGMDLTQRVVTSHTVNAEVREAPHEKIALLA